MIRTLVTLLAFAAPLIACADVGQSEITLAYRDRKAGKPPLRFYTCDLAIRNTRDTPVWIVYPNSAEHRLPPDGRIKVSHWEPLLFAADGFGIEKGYSPKNPADVGRFVRVHSIAGDKSSDHFYAIRLPAGASFAFAHYSFDAWKDVDSIEFIEASDILINGSVSFADWVPYDVTADKTVAMKQEARSNQNMNFDNATFKTRTDLRLEPVKKIELKILSRRVVPMLGAEPVKQQQGGASDGVVPAN